MSKRTYPFVKTTQKGGKKLNAIPVESVSEDNFNAWVKKQSKVHQNWISAIGYQGARDHVARLPSKEGHLEKVIIGHDEQSPFSLGASLHTQLSGDGIYTLSSTFNKQQQFFVAYGWAAAAYRFTRYKEEAWPKSIKLVPPKDVDDKSLVAHVDALYLVRDLINTPANDMGPKELAAAAKKIATEIGATYKEIVGDNLLKQNFPAIHAVGRASPRAPRLVEMTWGNPKHPKIALVGKGIVFDTGGLSIKPNDNMFLMKKDMGGAAHVLGMLKLIAAHKLPIHVHVLLPIAENSISGDAYRPSDIITSRSGITIEVGNTDAEGRVVMSDCFTYALEKKPEFLIDFATLTGHARSVVGYETAVFFANDKKLFTDIVAAGAAMNDPVWPLPLKYEYKQHLNSHVADIKNNPAHSYGVAIHAALFLERFLGPKPPLWAHIDCSGWTMHPSPGHPVGGEACGLLSMFKILQDRYQK